MIAKVGRQRQEFVARVQFLSWLHLEAPSHRTAKHYVQVSMATLGEVSVLPCAQSGSIPQNEVVNLIRLHERSPVDKRVQELRNNARDFVHSFKHICAQDIQQDSIDGNRVAQRSAPRM